jgi:hypothetical protein
MLQPIPFTKSYRQTLNVTDNSRAYAPVSVDDYVEKIQGCAILWTYELPHGPSGPQNIASTSTIVVGATPTIQVLRGDDKSEYWVLQNDAGTADYQYTKTIRIDPNNVNNLNCNGGSFKLEMKNRKARNDETGEIIDDASILVNYMAKIIVSYYHLLSDPGNILGAGVTNAIIGNLFVDYSLIIYILPQYAS